ncbi:MAG: translation elongation factor Ts [Gammaproteobacteria bacterium]|nr:translation elongation factor Ts [Gammaproteobacteria bacterium]MDH5513834.1 translation elongation factor Ts [Gammaproteobacteria bacterium]
MAITAAQVKELRERTGSGMMECKKALTDADGDMDVAIEALRKAGMAKADKKASRIAAEGLVVIEMSDDNKTAAIVEVNCETDFVAKKDDFQAFASSIAKRVLADNPADIDALMAMPLNDGDATTIEDTRKALIATIGENITVRRFTRIETSGLLAAYAHGVRIGVLVELDGGDANLGKDLAMHIAAHDPRPVCVSEDEVPAELIEGERNIFTAQARESGKPDNIIEKMIEGRIRKYLGEITLLGQSFVKNPDLTVGQLLEQADARVSRFERIELGEGIEKKSENFADEVMAQVKGG